jgi:FecR protein
MRRLPLQWILVGLSLLGTLPMASSAWSQPRGSIGRVTAVEGQAKVLRQGQFAAEPLVLQTLVFQEDIIETEVASKVRITLTDATVISLGEQTRLELKQFLYDTRQQTHIVRLFISSGVFRATVKTLIPQSIFEAITPTAVAAIRGTDLMGEVTANSTAIVVLEGVVVTSNVRLLFRGITTLTPGAGITVTADQPPGPPTQWSQSRIEALLKATTIQ